MKSVLTIGDGVAAWCLNFYLSKRENIQISNYSSDDFAPACSLRSTSINCMRGTQRGMSFLGDLMIDSMIEFEEFFQTYNPDGISKAQEIHFFNGQEKYFKRYSEAVTLEPSHDFPIKNYSHVHEEVAYLIDPLELKNWFLAQTPELNRQTGLVRKIEKAKNGYDVYTNGKKEFFDEVYVATSFCGKNLVHGFNPEFDIYLEHTKPVCGTYLEIDYDQSFGESECCYDLEGHHLIVKPSQNIVLLGSTSQEGPITEHNLDVFQIFDKVKAHYKGNLPEREMWRLKTGVRHKGRKRTPRWQEISPGLFVVTGLYKNGYSYAFKAARDLIISQRTPF